MTTTFPAHLAEAIRARIAVLRDAWQLDDFATGSQPRLQGYPTSGITAHSRSVDQRRAPRPYTTFPRPRTNESRSY
jgi:hypothetical protein